ncbi:hypothetical protein, partial [Enterococcus faecium]
ILNASVLTVEHTVLARHTGQVFPTSVQSGLTGFQAVCHRSEVINYLSPTGTANTSSDSITDCAHASTKQETT